MSVPLKVMVPEETGTMLTIRNQCRFAGAVGAEQGDDFALLDAHADVTDSLDRSIVDRYVVKLKHLGGRHVVGKHRLDQREDTVLDSIIDIRFNGIPPRPCR